MESNPRTTLVIVPPNDEEAYVIAEIGDRLGYRVHRSNQPHGARLEREPDVLRIVKDSDAATVIIVEMPGPEVEDKIRAMGKHLVVIDHHNYTELERAYAPDGSSLPSSLEQFLRVAGIEDVHLKRFGYEPDLVRGIGLWDAGYIWGVMAAGYSKERALEVAAYKDELAAKVGAAEADPVNREEAERAFKNRERYSAKGGDYFVVTSLHPTARVRSNLSRLFAFTYWKPTPLIISERGGERLYVQETDRALDLFYHFGGFTFGTDRNWGYENEAEKERVTLGQVKEYLSLEVGS